MIELNNDLKVLSINDVLSCCHDDSAGAGILYLHIEELINLVKQYEGIRNHK